MADFIGSAGRLSFSVGQGSREMSENGCSGHADRSCSRSMAFRNDFRSMFSLSALERLWLSIETSGPRYAVAELSESRGKPFLGRDHEFPAEVSSFSDETGCRDVIRYAEPSRRVSREGFDASGHAGRLLFRLRSEDQNHPFPLQTRHLLHFGPLFQIGREAQQQDFALILEDDLAASFRKFSACLSLKL